MKSKGVWFRVLVDLAVVLGLVFLGFELKQNTDMVQAQTRGEITQLVLTLIEMEQHPDIVAANLQLERGESITDTQRYLLEKVANATLRVWENTYYQYTAGLFDEAEFAADYVIWREAMADPIFIEHWRARRHTYSASFRQEIDDLLD